jgi:glycosyltransferase involved in cell wall biosynthesis
MSTNARKRVEENFTIEKMVDGYEKVYKNVTEASR